jgi:hypothetical protein
MDYLKTGAALQNAATAMLQLWQKAITQHFDFLWRGTELSQKFLAKALEVKTSKGFAGIALDYCGGLHKLAAEVACDHVTLAGEMTRVVHQSLVQPEAVQAPASAADTVEKAATGGYIAETQERSPEKVGVVNALREMTVAPAKARRKLRPKKA